MIADDWERVGRGLRSGSYNLLLGAGVSIDSTSSSTHTKHIGNLPGAGKLCQDLCDIKPNIRSNSSLSRVFRALTEKERDIHVTKRFINVIPGPTVEAITKFRWRRIFTLNIDDALENAYLKNVISPQEPKSLNYTDEYQDFRDKSIVPIIHLHGYTKNSVDGYIFDNKQYMRSISENNLWAHILGDIIASQPFIVMGTSLEEPDIMYFLSERDSSRVRTDKPPSIIIEPDPDDGTLQDCKDYRLSLVEQTASEFLDDLHNRFPDRPTLIQTIEAEFGTSLPDAIDEHQLARIIHGGRMI